MSEDIEPYIKEDDQELQDTIDAATTPEELEKLWPELKLGEMTQVKEFRFKIIEISRKKMAIALKSLTEEKLRFARGEQVRIGTYTFRVIRFQPQERILVLLDWELATSLSMMRKNGKVSVI